MEDQVIVNPELYSSKAETFSYKLIMLKQFQKVVSNGSKEPKKGFWIYDRPSPSMAPQKVKYIPDSRKEYVKSLNVLHDILLPKFDKEMQKYSDEIYKESDEWLEKCRAGKDRHSEDEIDDYWSGKLKIFRKLFQQLCFFLERKGWLDVGEVSEED